MNEEVELINKYTKWLVYWEGKDATIEYSEPLSPDDAIKIFSKKGRCVGVQAFRPYYDC